MITLILADDHQVVRQALHLLLERESDLKVIAETGDGLGALQLTEKQKPDVLIVDMIMPGLSGMEVARGVKRVSPQTKVLVLSMYDAEPYVVAVLHAGAAGYVLKKNSAEELIYAIRQVSAGNLYLSPSINERTIQAYLDRSSVSQQGDAYETLTPREREILRFAVEGLSNPQIAEQLSLSPRTVEMHRKNLMKKLGVKSQTELIKYAVKRGLVE